MHSGFLLTAHLAVLTSSVNRVSAPPAAASVELPGKLETWHRVTLTVRGPATSEAAATCASASPWYQIIPAMS